MAPHHRTPSVMLSCYRSHPQGRGFVPCFFERRNPSGVVQSKLYHMFCRKSFQIAWITTVLIWTRNWAILTTPRLYASERGISDRAGIGNKSTPSLLLVIHLLLLILQELLRCAPH